MAVWRAVGAALTGIGAKASLTGIGAKASPRKKIRGFWFNVSYQKFWFWPSSEQQERICHFWRNKKLHTADTMYLTKLLCTFLFFCYRSKCMKSSSRMTRVVTKKMCIGAMQCLQKYRMVSTSTVGLARHLFALGPIHTLSKKVILQTKVCLFPRVWIPNHSVMNFTFFRPCQCRTYSDLKSNKNVVAVRQKDKLNLDFDEEEDLRQLLEDVRSLFKTESFKLADLPDEAEEEIELLAKYLCLCQCSPANILYTLKENPEILKTPWSSLQKIILVLEEIGLRRGQLLKVLNGHKLLWESDEATLRKRLGQLRHLGFNESLRKTVAKWSQILTIPNKQINHVVEALKTCDFSRSEISAIIGEHPQMLEDSPEEIGRW